MAERARIRAPARRLDHRGQLVVEEFVEEAGRVRRRNPAQIENSRRRIAAHHRIANDVVGALHPAPVPFEPFGIEVDLPERLEQANEWDLPFAIDEEIDLGVSLEVGLLFARVDRVIRPPHHDHRARMVPLDVARVRARQRFVPHVVGETGDRWRLVRQEPRQGRRVLEQPGVDRVTEMRFGVGGDVANGEGVVVGGDACAGVRQVRE